ncbi:MAG: hypothetical protein LBP28_05035, partial [Coriobacteriales bacterium]|nr:hypothetical protein [Coriobacteriales bacterium]
RGIIELEQPEEQSDIQIVWRDPADWTPAEPLVDAVDEYLAQAQSSAEPPAHPTAQPPAEEREDGS